MEAATHYVHTMTDEPQPIDHEAEEFRAQLAAGMPEGEALGMAEARVDYLLERAGQVQERIARLDGAARARMKMIRESADEEIGKLARQIQYIESVIRLNLPGDAEHFAKTYGKKSIVLPHGKAGFRSRPQAVEINDMGTVVAWAAENGVPVSEKITRTVAKAEVMKWIERNSGEIPDGVEVVPASEKFYVSPDLAF